jgi:hypothetical protein
MSTIARVLLGAAFTLFAANYFVPFLPQPGVPPPEAGAFLGAFVSSGFMTLVKIIELATGLLLLTNRFVPLALALLAPILVGITAFHALLAPSGLAIPIALVLLELVLAWSYRDAFAPMLHLRTVAQPILRSNPAPTADRATARA